MKIKWWKLSLATGLVAVTAVVLASVPDILRYVRMHEM
jgi:hypothetical protein